MTQLEEERKKTHKETTNNLNLYENIVVKDKLEPPGAPLVTPESIQVATRAIKNILNLLGAKKRAYTHLSSYCIRLTENKENLLPNWWLYYREKPSCSTLRKANTDLVKEKGKLERK